MDKFKIALISGDGIGPEIMSCAKNLIIAIADKYNLEFEFIDILAGGCAIDTFGVPIRQEDIETAKTCDAVLLGSVGGKKWDNLNIRPEMALLALRKELNLYANLRPAYLFEQLICACPLKEDIAKSGIDIMIVRELTGGIYYGKNSKTSLAAYDTEEYSALEIERIAKTAFELAKTRRKKVTSVDKANVLSTSKLWREVVENAARTYPEVELVNMLVDNAAMQLVKDPSQFDVIVTSNMFGDILSDEAAVITGSIGMLPSASLGETKLGMYEPAHGSAPDIAGKNIANPLAMLLCVALMFKFSLSLPNIAQIITNAVNDTLSAGLRTFDIANGGKAISTIETAREVIKRI